MLEYVCKRVHVYVCVCVCVCACMCVYAGPMCAFVWVCVDVSVCAGVLYICVNQVIRMYLKVGIT